MVLVPGGADRRHPLVQVRIQLAPNPDRQFGRWFGQAGGQQQFAEHGAGRRRTGYALGQPRVYRTPTVDQPAQVPDRPGQLGHGGHVLVAGVPGPTLDESGRIGRTERAWGGSYGRGYQLLVGVRGVVHLEQRLPPLPQRLQRFQRFQRTKDVVGEPECRFAQFRVTARGDEQRTTGRPPVADPDEPGTLGEGGVRRAAEEPLGEPVFQGSQWTAAYRTGTAEEVDDRAHIRDDSGCRCPEHRVRLEGESCRTGVGYQRIDS